MALGTWAGASASAREPLGQVSFAKAEFYYDEGEQGLSALVGECLRESSGGWLTASRGLRVMARQAREARRGSTLRPVVSATGRLPDLTPEQIAWLRKRIDGTHGCIQRAADEWHVSRDAIKRAIKRHEIGGTPSDDPDDP